MRPDLREDLAHLDWMLGGLATVYQSASLDSFAFDPFSFQQDGLTASEVDVGWGEVVDALVIAAVVVVGHEGLDLVSQIAGQIVVLQQDAVLERQMPALDLSLCHRMIGRAADMPHVLFVEPCRQFRRDVARAVVG